MTALLMVLLTGFLRRGASARREAIIDRRAAFADTLTDLALAEITAKLNDAFSAEGGLPRTAHVTASPGLAEVKFYHHPPNRGRDTGAAAFREDGSLRQPFAEHYGGAPANPRLIPLFSWKNFAPHLQFLTISGGKTSEPNPAFSPHSRFNINTPDQPLLPGLPLLSGLSPLATGRLALPAGAGTWNDAPRQIAPGTAAPARPVWVQWIPLRRDPASPPSAENRITGRYAYWVDVENTKLHTDTLQHSLTDHPEFPRLIGESDAAAGAGSAFRQAHNHPARLARAKAEGLSPSVPVPPPTLPAGFNLLLGNPPIIPRSSRDGTQGPGFSAGPASIARQAFFGWDPEGRHPPLASSAPRVDWDFFTALTPPAAAGAAFGSSLSRLFPPSVSTGSQGRATDLWQLLPPRADARTEPSLAAFNAVLTATMVSSLTQSGYNGNLDPLGYPRTDIAAWQRTLTKNRTAAPDPAAILTSPLWTRLADSGYYRALFPGAWPANGGDRTLAHTLGAGDPAKGSPHLLQLLLNLAEASLPPDVPPRIDPAAGLCAARSIPYVAEVATRARSAFFLLPAGVRTAWLQRAAARDSTLLTESYGGHSFAWYASHVVLDLHMGLLNPDPFCTTPFTGSLEVNFSWHQPPAGSGLPAGDQILTAPIDGLYTATPEPGNDPTTARALGSTLYFPLGVVPATLLDDTANSTLLRIQGWSIKGPDGALWHRVPLRHPGSTAAPRPWWAMAASGCNIGEPADANSLFPYRETAGTAHAVGWFTPLSGRRLRPDALALPPEILIPGQTDPITLAQRLVAFGTAAGLTTRTERVVCEDPVLGHRTGDDALTGRAGTGHFYGAFGHSWRRLPIERAERSAGYAYRPPLPGQLLFETRVLTASAATYQSAGGDSLTFSLLLPAGTRLARRDVTLTNPGWTAVLGPQLAASYATHTHLFPIFNQTLPPTAPDSLTGFALCPELEGSLPQGDPALDLVNESIAVGQPSLKNADIEPPAGITPPNDEVAKLDRKKGPRGFHCHAPPGQLFTTTGQLGFVHSGFPGRPVMIGPDEGRTPWQLNSPLHGPPMRLLLDLLCDPVLAHPDGTAAGLAAFQAGHLPTRPLPAWNVNTAIAHDQYSELREGGLAWTQLKDERNPSSQPTHPVWLPHAQGHTPRATGNEAWHGKSLKDTLQKNPGHLLDPNLSPYVTLPRAWDMQVRFLSGDYSAPRTGPADLWGPGNALPLYFGSGAFTWRPGRGAGPAGQAWVDFSPDFPGTGALAAFGTDARKNDSNVNDTLLKGRFAADQNLAVLTRRDLYQPLHHITRHSLFPLRHFASDLPLQYTLHAEPADLRTALNPRQHASATPDNPEITAATAGTWEGTGFPGGAHSSGVFYQAPFALLQSRAGTEANAFSLYVVAQVIDDTAPAHPDQPASGPGHMDPTDTVIREVWSRIVLERIPDSHPPQWRTVSSLRLDH